MGSLFNNSSSSTTVTDIVRHFSVTKPRFDSIVEDPRLFEETAKALEGLGGAMEFPTPNSTRAEYIEWWKTAGPAVADIFGDWAGDLPKAIAATVTKTDLLHDGVPVRVLKKSSMPAHEKLPVVVYLHGGGFHALSFKDTAFDNYLSRLAAIGECVVVAVDFCSAIEQPFPAGLEDCYKVTKWVAKGGAASSGVLAGKVILAGDSAGANLAFGTALKAKQDKALDQLIAGLYLLCPYAAGVVTSTAYPSTMELDGYFVSNNFLTAVRAGVCDEDSKDNWFGSPLLFPLNATEEEMTGLPPTAVVVMQLDMLRDMGIELHYKLHEARVKSTLMIVGSGIHDQQLFAKHSPQVTDQSVHDLARFARFVSC